MFDYRNLNVWWRAKEMVRAVYELTAGYPPSERYGLTAQSRRAVVSIAANLAEGAGRRGSAEFARFVDIATGSAYELECHLLLAHDLRMIGDDELRRAMSRLDEIKRMLIGLGRRLRARKEADKA
ncbi:MAG TPA: four helix bundle protein [Acidimicrobiia bacterium]|nr:four helix bundle protein [Acidimicrobiia bacterium]